MRSDRMTASRAPVPSELHAGVLYVNPQGTRAHHLCACGCGQRVMTPLNDIEWELLGTEERPTLHPSIGNWNLNCRSHYILSNGRVRWARRFSSAEIEAVRRRDLKPYQQSSWLQRIGMWIAQITDRFRRG